jgi:hypothetical protein
LILIVRILHHAKSFRILRKAGVQLLPDRRTIEPFMVRLKRILVYDVRNYDGSWTEYANAAGVPVTNKGETIWLGK